MTGELYADKFSKCFSERRTLFESVSQGVDILNTDLSGAIKRLGSAANEIPLVLNKCGNLGADLKALEQWSQIFEDQALESRVDTAISRNEASLNLDIDSLSRGWSSGDWFSAGSSTASLLSHSVGPIQSTAFNSAENEYFAKDLSNSEAADLVAGFIFGLTGQDVQTKLTSCMKASPSLVEAFAA